MYLVVGSAIDPIAAWVTAGLRTRLDSTWFVPLDRPDRADGWTLRLGGRSATWTMRLGDRGVLNGDDVDGVMNCAGSMNIRVSDDVDSSDRAYGITEWNAAVGSSLYSLPCPVINRPHPPFLSGLERPSAVWTVMANLAGLPCAPIRYGSDSAEGVDGDVRFVFVLGDRVIADTAIPDEIKAGLRRLGRASREALLAVDMLQTPSGTWNFLTATVHPDLRHGKGVLLDALADELRA